MSREEPIIGDQRCAAKDCAAEYAPLTVDVLGRRVNHDGRTMLDRALQIRRGEAVVDHQEDSAFARERTEPCEVDQLETRIGRRLDEQ